MYCLDTYVLWEIHLGNKHCEQFLNEDSVLTIWSLTEFYRGILKDFNKQTADYWLRRLKPFCRDVDLNVLTKACAFQLENKKKRITLFDAVGYCFSLECGYSFVTGDKEFKGKDGVLFLD